MNKKYNDNKEIEKKEVKKQPDPSGLVCQICVLVVISGYSQY